MFDINFSQYYSYLSDFEKKLANDNNIDNPIISLIKNELEILKSDIYCSLHHVDDYCDEIINSNDNTITSYNSKIIIFEREHYKTDSKYLYYRFIEPNIFFYISDNSKNLSSIKSFYNLDDNISNIGVCLRQTDDGKWHIPLYISIIDENLNFKNTFILKNETSILKTALSSDSYHSLIKNGIQENTNILKNILISSLSIGTDWILHPHNNINIWIPDYHLKSAKILSANEENKRKEKDSLIKNEIDKLNRFDIKV